MNKIDFKFIAPIILLLIIIVAGIYFYQKNNQDVSKNQLSNIDSGGIILGDQTNDTPTNDTPTNSDQITEGALYNQKVLELRQAVNKGFEEISEKGKYKTLFNADDMQKLVNETRTSIENSIAELEKINIADKLQSANDKHLESLKLLLEAINAYDNSKKTNDKTEAQRLSELFQYNIEKSNNILKTIQIPN